MNFKKCPWLFQNFWKLNYFSRTFPGLEINPKRNAITFPGFLSFQLQTNQTVQMGHYSTSPRLPVTSDLLRVAAVVVGRDASHEGAVLDVLLVAGHVHRVLARLRRPVADVARAVVLVLAVDFGLRGALDGEAWRPPGDRRELFYDPIPV